MTFLLQSHELLKLPLACVIVGVAIVAIYRRVDVRLTLFVAAMLIGILAGDPLAIIRTFFSTLTNEKFVVPLCSAMGFAQVLRLTECDKHLVHMLVRPLKKVRFLLIPGAVVVGFLVNMPIISQTSTAVVLGTVVIPLLQAARFSPVTVGATLLIGSSIGGELLNPGAPELRTVVTETEKAAKAFYLEAASIHGAAAARASLEFVNMEALDGNDCVRRIFPLNMVGLLVGTAVFWWLCTRAERKRSLMAASADTVAVDEEAAFHINYLKASVPLIPLILLYLAAPPFEVIPTRPWLEMADPGASAGQHDTRIIALAMLIGVFIAVIVSPRSAPNAARAFFDGAGYAFANIVSLIVIATCFGKAIELIGVARLLGAAIDALPQMLLPLSGFFSLAFATLCGSGMATAQSLFGFFARPALRLGIEPVEVGAVVSLAAAAGRTM